MDVCMAMCTDVCMNVCTDMCTDMCTNLRMDMCIDVHVDAHADVCIGQGALTKAEGRVISEEPQSNSSFDDGASS